MLQKLQKKLEREAEQRRRQEEKKRKREEEQRRKENRKKGKKGKVRVPPPRTLVPLSGHTPCHTPLQKVVEPSRYFGSPIASVVDNGGVPLFVRKCVEIIENRGMTAVGLYRISGKKEDILALQDIYDQGKELGLCRDQTQHRERVN